MVLMIFFFNDTATTEIYTLSLHDALPIFPYLFDQGVQSFLAPGRNDYFGALFSEPEGRLPSYTTRSEEHTSELQSRQYLVCRLLLEKKKNTYAQIPSAAHTHSLAIMSVIS